jgi:two-component system, OmpR family, sensor histidine kinase CreC
MAVRLRADEPSEIAKEVGPTSTVYPVRPSFRPEPSPIAFAIHDAKNMLGVLSANLEVLTTELAGMPLSPMATDALGDMGESADRLSGLLREALAGLQGHAPRRALPTALRVAPIVAAVIDRMRPAARARGVRIVEGGDRETRATVESELFERVIENLLDNAVRFSKAGDTVEVEYVTRVGRTTLAVGDRGPGVPENDRDEIFASYRHREPGGTEAHFGLGLAFCREVARAHGGDAWVFNRGGGGACFVVETK